MLLVASFVSKSPPPQPSKVPWAETVSVPGVNVEPTWADMSTLKLMVVLDASAPVAQSKSPAPRAKGNLVKFILEFMDLFI